MHISKFGEKKVTSHHYYTLQNAKQTRRKGQSPMFAHLRRVPDVHGGQEHAAAQNGGDGVPGAAAPRRRQRDGVRPDSAVNDEV